MCADTLIESLSGRGFTVLADGNAIKVSPSSALTDEDRRAIHAHKSELLNLLNRPPVGSIARPRICRGARMPIFCPWANCEGRISGQGGALYLCGDCGTWFELRPLENPW
ncbi:MAG TPA: hypothetical protein VFV58_34780 [Blastocatellia bacterium]|jgi:hypothetical protein|nr:hypothetical protein [Blastocatellia bacterium]